MTLIGFRARNHPQQKRNPAVDDRATPPEMFGPLDARYRFTLDVAASAGNTKCPRFFSIADDGLTQSWAGERVWCNPPFSNIEPWTVKAHNAAAALVVMLLPANRTEQGWWQRQIEPGRLSGRLSVDFLPGRLRFIRAGADTVGPNERPPFGCCLVVWS